MRAWASRRFFLTEYFERDSDSRSGVPLKGADPPDIVGEKSLK
jgi:hypothetical protein